MKILTERQEDLLAKERALLSDLRVALVRYGMPADEQRTLDESIHQLDDFFLLVVVGEFNAGKSALINALLGQTVLEEGETPTTAQVHILRHGDVPGRSVVKNDLHILTAPVQILKNLSIVDTPGTNSIIRGHEEITSRFVPRSDLVLFVTSADRAFTDSERAFMTRIRDWGKKVIVLVNKVDILKNEQALANVERFVANGVRDTLGIEPPIFPVSAQLAQRAKHGEPALWQASRFEPLETHIADTLDEAGRLKLKLLNPMGVAKHLIGRYLKSLDEQLALFEVDVQMLQDVDGQISVYREDMQRDFDLRMGGIENILLEMEKRGRAFFDDTFQLRRVFDLIDRARVQRHFETQVVADVPKQVDRTVTELIDWLVDSDLRQWQAVTEHLAERRRQHRERIVGDSGAGGFHFERERMLGDLGRQVQQVVEAYDRTEEARSLAAGAQTAVAAVAAVEVGALGLGALVVALATTVAADVTGILAASAMAVLGLFIIPSRRRKAESEMRAKIGGMRDRLVAALSEQFVREMERILQRIDNTVAPYSRFVRGERAKLLDAQSELRRIQGELGALELLIEELGS